MLLPSQFLFSGIHLAFTKLYSQPSVEAWGNMTGIRVDGELMEFESSIRVVGDDWGKIVQTAKERQRPDYHRDGKKQIITTRIDSLYFEEVVEETGVGTADVEIKYTSRADTSLTGVFFCISVPATEYGNGTIQLIDPIEYSFANPYPQGGNVLLQMPSMGVKLLGSQRQIEVLFEESTLVIVKKNHDEIEVYMPIASAQSKQISQHQNHLK